MSIEIDLEKLAERVASKQTVLFIGSGMSLNADAINNPKDKFQTWDKLIEPMIRELLTETEFNISDLKKISYPEIIQKYEEFYGKSERDKLIREAVPTNDYKPGNLHKTLFDISKYPWHTIITTNIDNLIENTFYELDKKYTPVVNDIQIPGAVPMVLYKIHGTYDQPDSWVFSKKEYDNIKKNKPIIVNNIKALFSQYTCLFIGYSL